MLQIPFYHKSKRHDENGVALAENADLILYGYREAVGGGARISDLNTMLKKAKQFKLPEDDYALDLVTRDLDQYEETSGFGLATTDAVLLRLPVILEAAHIPRGHHAPKP